MNARLTLIIGGAAAVLSWSTPAHADIGFCNRSNELLSVAVWLTQGAPGDRDDDTIDGWFLIEPGSCSRTHTGDYRGRWMAFYAERYFRGERWIPVFEDVSGSGWFWLCVDPSGEPFEYYGLDTRDCRPEAKRVKFIQSVPNQQSYYVDLRIDSYF